ncbi:LysR family transcriptional regulator [Martelella alba]|uniref:LysR family transcriptional regulator n=1 Tax=Martelella alba TaxID=2590451 RepID=A0ABY2SLP4_9HYPH|nr:LysR family transcriptional regulator [Martelella alba]TKI05948.1 LysR family transcriptional regulator [Martelella alba]
MAGISLRHIDIFHAVMTTGNLTEAAALLHTSQPTVSRELARFEHLLQLTLFERVKGRLKPTGEGLRLFEEVQRAYYGLDRILSAARDIRQYRQTPLSVVCLPVFSQSLLPQVCRRFFTAYPAVTLRVAPQESPLLEEWLSAQRYDLGLTENTFTPAGTERQTLMTLDEVCVLPPGHPLCAKDMLVPEDFHALPFISLSATDGYRQLLDRLFAQRDITRNLAVETHSAAAVCAMVRAGVGLSVVNPLTALDYAANGVVVKPFSVKVPFTVSLIRPRHRPASSLVELFIDRLREVADEVPAALAAAGGARP